MGGLLPRHVNTTRLTHTLGYDVRQRHETSTAAEEHDSDLWWAAVVITRRSLSESCNVCYFAISHSRDSEDGRGRRAWTPRHPNTKNKNTFPSRFSQID